MIKILFKVKTSKKIIFLAFLRLGFFLLILLEVYSPKINEIFSLSLSKNCFSTILGMFLRGNLNYFNPLFSGYLSKCPILSELLTPVSVHKDTFWLMNKVHTLLRSLSNTLWVLNYFQIKFYNWIRESKNAKDKPVLKITTLTIVIYWAIYWSNLPPSPNRIPPSNLNFQ